jgi:ML-like domain
MARFPSTSWTTSLLFSLVLLSIPFVSRAQNVTYVEGTDAEGVTRLLRDDRYPALYTGDFADCLAGESLLNVTRFDAAYYADNMTVLFHLTGTTNLKNESLMSKLCGGMAQDLS